MLSGRGETQSLNSDVGSLELEGGYPDKPLRSMDGEETRAHMGSTCHSVVKHFHHSLALEEFLVRKLKLQILKPPLALSLMLVYANH